MLEFGGRVSSFLFMNDSTILITGLCGLIYIIGLLLCASIKGNKKLVSIIDNITVTPLALWVGLAVWCSL